MSEKPITQRIKDRLAAYTAMLRDIDNQLERLDRMEMTMASPPGPDLTGMPRGSGTPSDRTGMMVERKMELEEQIDRLKAEEKQERNAIEGLILQLSDPDERAVIRLRYFDRADWESTCGVLFGDRRDYVDRVDAYPGSMVMIHGVAGLLYDYYTLADLKKLQKDFDASERAIAEIYHAKTGLEVDQLRSMMTRETWMVGQEAIDNGFADTLLTDEGPDVTLSADKKVLLVAGIRHDVKGFRHIPGTIPIDNSIHAAPAAGNKHAAAKNDGPKKEDNKTMTLEEMRAQHPDVVAQIEQQAAETARTQERARIEAIDSIAASVGDAQLVRDAKYGETPCTAEQLALKAMQKQAALGAKHLKDAKADNDESGAAGVGAAPNGGEEGSENDDKAKVDAIVGLYNSTKSQNGGKK